MSEELKSGPAVTGAEPKLPEPTANGKLPEVRDASWERFQQVKRKVFALSDGLLRKLAEHDRQP